MCCIFILFASSGAESDSWGQIPRPWGIFFTNCYSLFSFRKFVSAIETSICPCFASLFFYAYLWFEYPTFEFSKFSRSILRWAKWEFETVKKMFQKLISHIWDFFGINRPLGMLRGFSFLNPISPIIDIWRNSIRFRRFFEILFHNSVFDLQVSRCSLSYISGVWCSFPRTRVYEVRRQGSVCSPNSIFRLFFDEIVFFFNLIILCPSDRKESAPTRSKFAHAWWMLLIPWIGLP